MLLFRPGFLFFSLTFFCLQALAGPLVRVPNTSMHMPTNPPTFGFTAVNAFPTLTFTNPTTIVSIPGETNRLFVVEKRGRIVVITNLAAPTRTMFLDISARVTTSSVDTGAGVGEERGLLGLAFHPGYASNGYFYVFYTGNTTTSQGSGLHDILSRFQVSSQNPNQGDAASEIRFITQYDEAVNHNAGDFHFGPDGYLYVSLGDEGGAGNQFSNAQKADKDFFSAIMRLDVDKRPGSLPPHAHPALPSLTNYSIPPDNALVGASTFNGLAVNPANVHTEFWATGMRNPWRFSFDSLNGTLFLGHVGQDNIQWLNIVTNGANCGWSFYEGTRRWTNSLPPGFNLTPESSNTATPMDVSASLVESCIAGRASPNFMVPTPMLITAAAKSGRFALPALLPRKTPCSSRIRARISWPLALILPMVMFFMPLVGAATTPKSNGSPIIPAPMARPFLPLWRTPAPSRISLPSPLPRNPIQPAPGIVPYDINLSFWSDNALKSRWFSVPNPAQFVTFNPAGNWTFPTGTVWIKHFNLQLTNGAPESLKRIETRFLVKNAAGIYGLTYRWGNSATNATLVPEEGLDEAFTINDGGGILRTQVWHYPSRVECSLCHTPAAGFALGFNTPQLNREFNYSGASTNQLNALSDAGYFTSPVAGVHTLAALAHITNSSASLEYRVRSYLAANCSQCHQPSTGTRALWDARITTPTAQAGIINGLLFTDSTNSTQRVVKPGSLSDSMMLTRISSTGALRMPPIDSNLLDTNAIQLLSAWITNDLPAYQSFADWQLAFFNSTNAPESAAFADPDADGAVNLLEYLTGTDPLSPTSNWGIGIGFTGTNVQINFTQIANRGFELQGTTNVFNPGSWTPLDLPGNEPFFSITNRAAHIQDSLDLLNGKFYRVRVFSP